LLEDVPEITLHMDLNGLENIVFIFPVSLPDARKLRRYLLRRGVDVKKCSMRDCPRLMKAGGEYPQCAGIEEKLMELPCYPRLSRDDIYYQANLIREFYGKTKKECAKVSAQNDMGKG
ncbi:MAG: hypothetical protein K8I00_07485, partial [Candidatus Omnitrophica bacterium]|nr:hypothetical protein [Candidatus Omnitrophota bacterium]